MHPHMCGKCEGKHVLVESRLLQIKALTFILFPQVVRVVDTVRNSNFRWRRQNLWLGEALWTTNFYSELVIKAWWLISDHWWMIIIVTPRKKLLRILWQAADLVVYISQTTLLYRKKLWNNGAHHTFEVVRNWTWFEWADITCHLHFKQSNNCTHWKICYIM